MSSEWSKMPFSDFISLQRGHDLPEQERKRGNVPILGSFGVTGWHNKALAKAPGLTIGRSGASFGTATYTERDYFPLNTTLYVTDFKGSHPRFAYYFAKHFDFSAYNSGSAQPSLNRNFINPVEVSIPPLAEQQAIAHILGTFDDKIELTRKTNETLEAMAKALFKSWFVDFDPVRAKAEGRSTGLPAEISDLFPDSFEDSELGEIPSGWSVCEIDQVVNLRKDSIDPASAPDEIFDHYSIPAFDAGKYPVRELGSSIKSQKFLVGDGDLLVSKLNPSTPRVWIPFASSGSRAICSTEFLVCRTSSVCTCSEVGTAHCELQAC
jgi:type I restriction enzyme S subunit